MDKMVELKPVSLSAEMHEHVRREAFRRRVSMKQVVEEALKFHYGWKPEEVSDGKDEMESAPGP